ncbi:hypothetical protein [Bernardetia sp.]|uniref:hypothetical protein n=1 Tax=Bernardetia sp. TaxID=1937974 RepID=UPI0025B93D9A|nr:hypothetical protein [Bernardetia sp.]
MKKLFNISFVLLAFFLLGGNQSLYAHTNTVDETKSSEDFFEKFLHKFELNTSDTDLQVGITILQSESSHDRNTQNKDFDFPLFEKEEKEKEDKFSSFEIVSKQPISLLSTPVVFFFDRFYQYNKSYLRRNESLNYFLFHKCYVLFQVFRL